MGALALLLFLVLRLFAVQAGVGAGIVGDDGASCFTACLAAAGVRNVTTRGSPGYGAALGASIQNLRFAGAGAPKPAAVVAPASLEELRAAVRCARAAGLVVRLRSGGHSYEGLSYTTEDRSAFAVVDLAALDGVRVDASRGTAWVEAGATLGQLRPVPERVTAFAANRPGSAESVARLVSAWQRVAPRLPVELYVSAFVGAGLPESSNRTTAGVSVTFKGLYLGPSHEALRILAGI
ncbi:hypothetical protein C2845_PM13G03730 [Panicum miliaceum]|uniref:FAD-binding PCMH-type domain-containing protein n=1 Tax=Panicum miliaceum TaxID=4540 RepID=A0A3L6RF15_PANMI|nr:hypothetical protein C2845_PM13G03730 [Panicum miliaceum]